MMDCMRRRGNKAGQAMVLAFRKYVVKRMKRFSFSDIQALRRSTVVSSCTHSFFSFLALIHLLYSKYSFFSFFPFQPSHQRQPFAVRELGLGFIGRLPCRALRWSGKLPVFVFKYCKSHKGDACV